MSSESSQKVDFKMIKACRLCMSEGKDFENIFSALGFDGVSYANMTSFLSNLPVEATDGLPYRICAECSSRLDSCFEFRKIIIRSFYTLSATKATKDVEAMVVKVEPADVMGFDCDDNDPSPTTPAPPDDGKKRRKRLTRDQCPLCLAKVGAGESLARHLASHYADSALKPLFVNGKKSTACNLCERTFRKDAALARHHRTHLNILPYECARCDRRFACAQYLKNHVEEHDAVKRFQCKTCGKLFKLKASLKTHEQSHVRDAAQCDVCKKSYRNKSHLVAHLKVHRELNFACTHPGCKKACRSELELHHHVQRSHLHVKPFMCNECGKAWYTKAELTRHEQRHAAVKRFRCDECYKRFTTKQALQGHAFLHAEQKPFACELCSVRFNRRSNFNKHMKKNCKELKKLNDL